MDSCQPNDLKWELIKNFTETYEITYYFLQGELSISLPPPIVTNDKLDFSINRNSFLEFEWKV